MTEEEQKQEGPKAEIDLNKKREVSNLVLLLIFLAGVLVGAWLW